MPVSARLSIRSGAAATALRRNTSIGIRCSAEYTGSMNRNTVKNRRKPVSLHLSAQGCSIEHGMW